MEPSQLALARVRSKFVTTTDRRLGLRSGCPQDASSLARNNFHIRSTIDFIITPAHVVLVMEDKNLIRGYCLAEKEIMTVPRCEVLSMT
jgi:hypothetical protein